jgi:hypothetical protein
VAPVIKDFVLEAERNKGLFPLGEKCQSFREKYSTWNTVLELGLLFRKRRHVFCRFTLQHHKVWGPRNEERKPCCIRIATIGTGMRLYALIDLQRKRQTKSVAVIQIAVRDASWRNHLADAAATYIGG